MSTDDIEKLVADLQGAFSEASSDPRAVAPCAGILNKIKERLTQCHLKGFSGDARFLSLAREAYEIGALLSLQLGDVGSFDCYYSYLHPFYFDYTGVVQRSERTDVVLGLRMLHLLTENRIGDFYMLLELLPADIRASRNIQYVVELERSMMEGKLTRLIDVRQTAPSAYYWSLADKLADTARNKIAAAMEIAYPSLGMADAAAMLKLRDVNELASFMNHYNKSRKTDDSRAVQWRIEGDRVCFVSEAPVRGSVPSKEMLAYSLGYIEELEKIV
ncbi:26S proteasome non-ATPase regulatory subunit Nin1/mts3 family protein, putative [Babesia bigemina]|uniref:26S proteasome non-ATPase regulatory subunit Nin1/mts3 family protein, putative n=1 Tax=Babesia bigemina TaxID=5866 RepID=A0A061D984_BABBI|nr:26S proteasome non-ATPase regulatory subunit Nin1/mts3 family protein, putative [Babesia bigemina]CDR97251.1 26S proteasome non-ATPase regulatory subunit Nin1/mts3 family protein, putative [Babesia bigemina]|eukprot:XP_012769437.1 26S proteasome non-ATPase regulatory subunit Nin1/mts3 family protein, putative [Babesia bigemina]